MINVISLEKSVSNKIGPYNKKIQGCIHTYLALYFNYKISINCNHIYIIFEAI